MGKKPEEKRLRRQSGSLADTKWIGYCQCDDIRRKAEVVCIKRKHLLTKVKPGPRILDKARTYFRVLTIPSLIIGRPSRDALRIRVGRELELIDLLPFYGRVQQRM
jgi:hypothetical protein